jgi:hypothetical protein
MVSGGRTPEELETLLEDAVLMDDADAAARLFEPYGLLFAEGTACELVSREGIRRAAAGWLFRDGYLGTARHVLQAGDTALLLGADVVSVVRRREDGSWKYVICFLAAGQPASTAGGTISCPQTRRSCGR